MGIKKLSISMLKALVIDEATKLKANITKDEAEGLSINWLLTSDSTRCVYGQITGSCWSARAIDLIKMSCERVLVADKSADGVDAKFINGSPFNANRHEFWSPIEVFIDRVRNKENGNNAKLIAFLKDETKTLKLK